MQIDVFNGDADGICALIQLRLDNPCQSKLVTGTKRDILLLEKLSVGNNDQVTVLDISLERNRHALARILDEGAHVFYVDHHQSGAIPIHPRLTTLIKTDSNVCTSLLVNGLLHGKYRAWAVTAAFGDNLIEQAEQTALPLKLSNTELNYLKDLGKCINYNSYGRSISDLHFAPDELYRELASYTSPLEFIMDNQFIYQKLLAGYQNDMTQALQIKAEYSSAIIGVYILPDEAWARRVSGVFGNELANQNPSRAHAVVSNNAQGDFQVSVRAPQINKNGADELCSLFPTGGGRKSAAGINHLPANQLPAFIKAFEEKYN
jgi:nanoRNase/pAp phosphatase (c-di-AMP/oligoRNAs hydrolase)